MHALAILGLGFAAALLASGWFLGVMYRSQAAPAGSAATDSERRQRRFAVLSALIFLGLWIVFDQLRLPYAALCFAAGAAFSVSAGRLALRSAAHPPVGAFRHAGRLGLLLAGQSLLAVSALILIYSLLGQSGSQLIASLAWSGLAVSGLLAFARFGDAFGRILLRAGALAAADLGLLALLAGHAERLPMASLAQALSLLAKPALFAGLFFGGLLCLLTVSLGLLGLSWLGEELASPAKSWRRVLAALALPGLPALLLSAGSGLLLGGWGLLGVLGGASFTALLLGLFALTGVRPRRPARPERPSESPSDKGVLFDELFQADSRPAEASSAMLNAKSPPEPLLPDGL